MTAEVGVMNKIGVALAADSAVALGPNAEKVYTSADKLFQLSEYAPVGVMIYGTAQLLQVPWETIIKTYRSTLGRRTFPRLSDYARDFLRYMKASTRMFPQRDQRAFVEFIASDFFSYFRKKRLEDALGRELKQKGHLSEEEVSNIFTKLVREELERTKQHTYLDGLPTNIAQIIRTKYRKDIASARQQVFEKFPMSRITERRLIELISELLCRRQLISSGVSSGVVIAGFGEKEHFPAIAEIIMPGIVAGHSLYQKGTELQIGINADACLVPFAQKEMVLTFMSGIDPELKTTIEQSTQSLFNQVAKIILAEVQSKYSRFGKNLEKKVLPELAKLIKELGQQWDETRQQKYTNPVMEMVASLPKDELAAMAESLVNLTKFKRRVSKQQETVGGPIDVAVITKGDGFVWVKRKHYFDPEVNPRYLARLHRRDIR